MNSLIIRLCLLAVVIVAVSANYPYPRYCRYGKNGRLNIGQVVRKGCNSCTCLRNGRVVCKNTYCRPCKIGKKWVKHGFTYKKRCNTCKCNNGKINCSNNACCRLGKTWVPAGTKVKRGCRVCTCGKNGKFSCVKVNCPCKYRGKVYKHGQVFKNKCNNCKCNNGNVKCGDNSCCIYGKKWLTAGDSFKKGCQKCTCMKNGKINCVNVNCPCKVGNKSYKHGKVWNWRCNKCKCNNANISCTKRACCKKGKSWVSAGHKYKSGCKDCMCRKNGKITCRVSPRCACKFGKRMIPHGKVFKVRCNTCKCWSKKVSCTKKGCCKAGKKWYSAGDKVKRACNTCVCRKAKKGYSWGCTKKYCYKRG